MWSFRIIGKGAKKASRIEKQEVQRAGTERTRDVFLSQEFESPL